MPFYEYECPHCGYDEEVLQKITDKPLTKCPSCGKKGLKKLMSAPLFRLKGSGWYETDFKGDKEAKRNIAGEKEPAAAGASPTDKPKDEKSEAKPAEKKPDAGAAAKPDAAAKKPKPARPKRARRRPSRR